MSHKRNKTVTLTPSQLEAKIEDSKPSETQAPLIVSPEYQLFLEVTGLRKHNEKYETAPMELTARQTLLNYSGSFADTHVRLDVGSTFDVVSRVKVNMLIKDEVAAFIEAVYLESPKPHWFITQGRNESGLEFTPSPLAWLEDGSKKEDGTLTHAKGDFIISKVKCPTYRFMIRELTPHLVARLSERFVYVSSQTANVDSLNAKLEAELAKQKSLARSIFLNGKKSLPVTSLKALLVKCNANITELTAKIAASKMTQDDEDVSDEDIQAIIDASNESQDEETQDEAVS